MNGLPGLRFKYTIEGGEADANPESPSLGMFMNFNFIKGVSLEAISEVNLTNGIAPAEIANAMSGGISLTTKGGTNEYHGTAFLNNQTEKVAARNQFLATRTPLVFNQFGFSLGGPIIKNKLFAFGVFEGYRWSFTIEVKVVGGCGDAAPKMVVPDTIYDDARGNGLLEDPVSKRGAAFGVTGFWRHAEAEKVRADGLTGLGGVAAFPHVDRWRRRRAEGEDRGRRKGLREVRHAIRGLFSDQAGASGRG